MIKYGASSTIRKCSSQAAFPGSWTQTISLDPSKLTMDTKQRGSYGQHQLAGTKEWVEITAIGATAAMMSSGSKGEEEAETSGRRRRLPHPIRCPVSSRCVQHHYLSSLHDDGVLSCMKLAAAYACSTQSSLVIRRIRPALINPSAPAKPVLSSLSCLHCTPRISSQRLSSLRRTTVLWYVICSQWQ